LAVGSPWTRHGSLQRSPTLLTGHSKEVKTPETREGKGKRRREERGGEAPIFIIL